MATDKDLELEKKTAYDKALEAMNAPKPTYAGTFDKQLSDIYDKIANRDKFSYDAGKDPMYQMSKDRYTQLGKLAMKDTMGQASALTGGYGSTYGQQVGQQAYDAQLQGLNDVVPELYQMAYGMYADEGDKLQNQYAMIGQRQSDEYVKYRDSLGDYNVEQADAYGKAMDGAALMAQYGDFSGFGKLYGEEKGKLMAETWYQQNPDLALKLGLIDQTKYNEITGAAAAAAAQQNAHNEYWARYDPEIAALQRELNSKGANLVVDGVAGPLTNKASDYYYPKEEK